MPQYAVLIYEGVAVEDLPKEIMDGHMNLPDRIAEAGGRVVAGLALQDQSTATGIRDGLLTDGPFMETKESLGGIFIIEAARPRPRAHAGEADPDRRGRRRGPAVDRLPGASD